MENLELLLATTKEVCTECNIMTSKNIWITWEDHRRSRELAKALEANYVAFHQRGSRYIRYPMLGLKTIFFLLYTRPDTVYCQNPSIILTTIVCFLKRVLGYKVIVDRHSNFKFQLIRSKKWKWKIFHLLSRYTIRKADLTIVTNDYLKDYVDSQNGHGFVLPDKLPTLSSANIKPLKGEFNFVFISTFSDDEPIEAVITAMIGMDQSCHLYVTGRYSSYPDIDKLLSNLPTNVTLTGFLSEFDYQSLIASADTLIIITDQEYTLTCGAYEAVALEKPMVLGDTETLRNYFSLGAVYTGTDTVSIMDSLKLAKEIYKENGVSVKALKKILILNWNTQFSALQEAINKL